MTQPGAAEENVARRCAACGTELPPHTLACGACGTLVYSAKLKELAAAAERQSASGDLTGARTSWERALRWLPEGSSQHAVISAHIAELAKRIDGTPAAQQGEPEETKPWWKRGAAAAIALVLFALGKLKFLLLGLSKAGTLFSMFAFFGVYWAAFGWPLAAGLAISIYIHEMGHVAALRSAGIEAGAPFFVPGLGAFVLLKQHITDPRVDARVGLAGPVWGLGAAVAAFAAWRWTGVAIWGAIAHLGAYINLFNLIPFWQLDGSRGFHALATWQRWVMVGVLAVAYLLTHQGLLLLIGAVAIYRAFQPAVKEADESTLGTFVILVAALSWLATISVAIGAPPGR